MSLSLGFIGAGNMGTAHLTSAQQLGIPLLGVADIDPAAGQAAQKKFGVEKIHGDFRSLLEDKRIDAVVIATPNKFHVEHAIGALEAGKHVFLEKPMAMNVAQCDAIIAAAKRSGCILQMGMVNRFRSSAQSLRTYVDAGKCGRIYAAQAYMVRRRGIPGFGGWFTTKEMSGGGALIDIGVHILDLTMYLWNFPKPVAVCGSTYNIWNDVRNYTYISMWGKPQGEGKKDVDDLAVAMVRFEGGATLQLNVSWSLNIDTAESYIRLCGDRGGVQLRNWDETSFASEELGHLTDTKILNPKNNPNLEEIKHFLECISEKHTPLATAEQGRTVQSILDGIYRSSAEGREVRL